MAPEPAQPVTELLQAAQAGEPAGSIRTAASHGPSAAALDDPPRPNVTEQTVPAMARARVHGEVA
jgi:hypothetical protein